MILLLFLAEEAMSWVRIVWWSRGFDEFEVSLENISEVLVNLRSLTFQKGVSRCLAPYLTFNYLLFDLTIALNSSHSTRALGIP